MVQDTMIDDSGKFVYSDNYFVIIEQENCGYLEVGTDMIRRIIENPYLCLIEASNGHSGGHLIVREDASIQGVGTGTLIDFNIDSTISVLTETGNAVPMMKEMPKEIELGHELIHSLRAMGGYFKEYNDDTGHGYGMYAYETQRGNINIEKYRKEELETTGISYYDENGNWINASEWVTTENSLRREHGYGRRVLY